MVTILMAVYNGETYVKDQILSIVGQTETDWRLVIQDDCSTDDTVEVVQQLIQQYPDKMELHQNKANSGSPQKNFFSMLAATDGDYIMTCDHDDIWLPKKIQMTLEKMRQLEQQYGTNSPLLVHTDLQPVDQNLNPLSNSMFDSQCLNRHGDDLNHLLAQNIVTGCTMMVNRAMLRYCKKIPDRAIMHDWWLGLVASTFGEIGFVDRPTILYRQHGGNQVGAKEARSTEFVVNRLKNSQSTKQVVQDTYRQAAAFLDYYGDQMNPKKKKIVQAYAGMLTISKIRRWGRLFRYRFFKYGFIRKVGQFIYI